MLNGSKTIQTQGAEKPSFLPVIAILAVVLILIAGFFLYMRRRRAKSG
jgi:LPXTG-motif cell wall-anchored protein